MSAILVVSNPSPAAVAPKLWHIVTVHHGADKTRLISSVRDDAVRVADWSFQRGFLVEWTIVDRHPQRDTAELTRALALIAEFQRTYTP